VPSFTLEIEANKAKPQEIEGALRRALAEMADPSTAVGQMAAASSIDPAQVGTEVTVSEPTAGFDPGTILVVVLGGVSAGAGKAVANKAWDEILGPVLKDRLGLDSIGRRKKSKDDDDQ
jgi:hypothetical protein